jgi:hypothetical protein
VGAVNTSSFFSAASLVFDQRQRIVLLLLWAFAKPFIGYNRRREHQPAGIII